jgi:hypothetical protein
MESSFTILRVRTTREGGRYQSTPLVDPAQLWVLVGSGPEDVGEHHGLADVGVLGRGEQREGSLLGQLS